MSVARRMSIALMLSAVGGQGAWAAPDVSTEQRQVAIGYDRLETLALRIADSVEASDPARADQVREAIGEARTLGVGDRFAKVVGLLERERYAAARRDQALLAQQLEELLRLVMADPNAARLEEERQRLEELQRGIRSALREQRTLRDRSSRGATQGVAERQAELASRIERLIEPAQETDRLNGKSLDDSDEAKPDNPLGDPAPTPGASQGAESLPERSISGSLKAATKSSRQAAQQFAEEPSDAEKSQRQTQRSLEAAQREAEERLRQIREEEQQRRLASLAERFRRMREIQSGLIADTKARIEVAPKRATPAGIPRSVRVAAAKFAARQGEVGNAAENALRVVRADGSSLVFDDVLVQTIQDIDSSEARLQEGLIDATTLALEQIVMDSLAEMIAAVDQSLDELEQKQQSQAQGQSSQGGGEQSLVSKIAELRIIRAIQARLLRQTEVWNAAFASGEADPEEVADRLQRLADEQRRLWIAAEAAADGQR